MKGTILFLIIFTLAWLFPALSTDGFTYLYGDLNPKIKMWAWMVIGAVYIITLFVPLTKRWAAKAKVNPFREI